MANSLTAKASAPTDSCRMLSRHPAALHARHIAIRSVVNIDAGFSDCGIPNCMGALENNIRNVIIAKDGNQRPIGAVFVASANNQKMNNCASQSPARMGYGGMYDPYPEDRDVVVDGILYPADRVTQPFVITVGGTNINDQQYYCPTCAPQDRGSNFGPCVDIYAAGQRIRSAHVAAANAYRDEQQWVDAAATKYGLLYRDLTLEKVYSGTSWSAAMVSGAAARLLQTFPNMSIRDVWNTLRDTATPLSPNFDGDNVPQNDKLLYVTPSY